LKNEKFYKLLFEAAWQPNNKAIFIKKLMGNFTLGDIQ